MKSKQNKKKEDISKFITREKSNQEKRVRIKERQTHRKRSKKEKKSDREGSCEEFDSRLIENLKTHLDQQARSSETENPQKVQLRRR